MEKDPKHFADLIIFEGFPMAQWKKTLPAVLEMQKAQFNPYVGKIPREEELATLSRILAWRPNGQRSLVDYGPWGHKELGTAEHTLNNL